MSLVTLADLRTQARNRSDMRVNGIFTDADFNSAINAGIFELYDLQVKCWGDNYFLTSSIVPLTQSRTLYSLPASNTGSAGIYKLVGIDLQSTTGGSWRSLHSYEFQDRNKFSSTSAGGSSMRYCLYGSGINLLPAPTSGQQIQIWYVPQPAKLENDTDTFDFTSGWDRYPVLFACIQALAAEESDTTVFERQLMQMRERIEDMAPKRDIGEPHSVVDVEQCSYWDQYW
jgi:hypothetical protein